MTDDVTVLVKRPDMEWDEPVVAFESREDAERAKRDLGVDVNLTEVGRLVDAPLVPEGENGGVS